MISVPTGAYRAEGMIKNVNTLEEYRDMDKAAMLLQAGKTVSAYHFLRRHMIMAWLADDINKKDMGCDK